MKIIETETGLPVFAREYVRKKTGALVPCPGEAHRPEAGGMIDNCGLCAPRWGEIEELEPITLERAYEILGSGFLLAVNDVADRRQRGKRTVYDVLRDDPQIEMVNVEKKIGKKSAVNYNVYRAAVKPLILPKQPAPEPADIEINWPVVHVQIEQIKRRGWTVKFSWHKRATGEEWAVEICDAPGSVVQATARELSEAIAEAVRHAGT